MKSCRITILLFCLLLPLAVRTAPAAGGTISPQTLTQLDSPDFNQREQALAQILRDESLTPQEIVTYYRQSKSLEVKNRLLDAARHHLVRIYEGQMPARDQPGAVGVALYNSPGNAPEAGEVSGVRIQQTFPGLPGYAYLQANDLVLQVNDRPLAGGSNLLVVQRFIELVAASRARSKVTLLVQRGSEKLTMTFALSGKGNFERLYGGATGQLAPVYQVRWQQFYDQLLVQDPHPPALKVDLPPAPRISQSDDAEKADAQPKPAQRFGHGMRFGPERPAAAPKQ